ncbi:MAG: hypothetical protein HFF17_16295, partial [Oscillospiraceae bacterium]|nr:hypothetical protein [Oscillospiraceae bacterium]
MDQSYLLNMLATGLTKMDWVGGSQNTAPDKSGDPMSDFQKMLDEKAQSAKPESKEPPKEEAAPAPKKEEAPVREEDPVETVKRMQVCLVPV